LKDQLLFLLQLQTIDLRVKELEAAKAALPMQTEPLRNDLAKLQGMLSAERAKLTETEAWKRQQALILEREQEALRAAKSKLQATRTGKEFHAATREVEFKRKSINEREAELKKVGEALGSSGAVIDERDGAVQKLREDLVTEEARIAGKLEEVAAQIAEVTAGRDELRGKIDKHWLKTYDSLIKRGIAIATVENGTCKGCRVRIPPQLNNKLARLESLETCERCGRILYRQEMITPAGTDDAPAA
jgi:predicted  nucleic acid-binding Zn-ribbon protein